MKLKRFFFVFFQTHMGPSPGERSAAPLIIPPLVNASVFPLEENLPLFPAQPISRSRLVNIVVLEAGCQRLCLLVLFSSGSVV